MVHDRSWRTSIFHQPGTPLVLANVYDILPTRALASLPRSKALATANYAVAAAQGSSKVSLSAIKDFVKSSTLNKDITTTIDDIIRNVLVLSYSQHSFYCVGRYIWRV
jgi:hypothetical protein